MDIVNTARAASTVVLTSSLSPVVRGRSGPR
uniref:Cytochrome b6/f complex subunit VIII n=2 Tax=Selaginella TaxID=3246 RepID=A0A482A2X7_SELUN|nr:cytochrome b6/f complex subunit VIII [Selaginella uncinata]YP_009589569.1 cytochrome b6/f complex subunit VIII [Selaginella hainanensis]QBL07924.1 cytochrome b6/f complex subunit VIII [Selaginella uncinata]QBL76148.1 cytochrome b6/f complex subunit VIII [Selaginella hainanensis]